MGIKARVFTVLGVMGISWFGWWVSDIPIGYYEFRERCNKEGGARLLGVVTTDSGWMASSEVQAKSVVASYRFVPFARYVSDSGQLKDVRYKGSDPLWSGSYVIEDANLERVVNYKYFITGENVPNAIRLRKDTRLLVDLLTEKELFISISFTYTWTNPERTLLGRSDKVRCPAFVDERNSINSLF
ncbi:hypothetical protein [Pseudomonas indica]|uniref:hypothetical protein n=1 Tax=Pseudomonas indica TaxID=137658 RepID=UPI003FD2086B